MLYHSATKSLQWGWKTIRRVWRHQTGGVQDKDADFSHRERLGVNDADSGYESRRDGGDLGISTATVNGDLKLAEASAVNFK
ncbi:MAG TPA: hypothetical protein VHT28_15615 [Silvibacterium sp.]|nr:hypothetical protein [Silvibacterium sp.]